MLPMLPRLVAHLTTQLWWRHFGAGLG